MIPLIQLTISAATNTCQEVVDSTIGLNQAIIISVATALNRTATNPAEKLRKNFTYESEINSRPDMMLIIWYIQESGICRWWGLGSKSLYYLWYVVLKDTNIEKKSKRIQNSINISNVLIKTVVGIFNDNITNSIETQISESTENLFINIIHWLNLSLPKPKNRDDKCKIPSVLAT